MKKNVMMRVASLLMVCVLATTCGISGTFAKYVTADSAADNARVAKWGVTVVADGSLFSDKYVAVADGNVPGTANLTVFGSEKVVAPGTKSPVDGVNFTIAGTPEVMVDIKVTASLTLSGWKQIADWDGDPATADSEEEYCPLIFTVGAKTYFISTTDDGVDTTVECADVAALQTTVSNAIVAELAKDDVDAKTNLADSLIIAWEWPFTTGAANDIKDTALGNLAAAGKAGTIDFEMTVTVEQVD